MTLLLRKNKNYLYEDHTVKIYGYSMFPVPTIFYKYYIKDSCIFESTNLFKFILKAK